ncbi:Xaa-Pro aminopeptidase [Acetobacter estunensis NRIC 0472]|nr:aminopeptidase P family protein [Acetobacter estunensis]GBQ22277.1 Xaa-Pro aminopeptidase [Acetobacter estunensis NRIC 0472]
MAEAPHSSADTMGDRLRRLRALMEEHDLAGLIVPHSDEYLGEYTPACAERLAWITGFTGSAGLAIVLRERAAVFSDGRYITQMDDQVDGEIWDRLHISQTPPQEWLKDHATPAERIGYDPRIISAATLNTFAQSGANLVPTSENLIDRVWADRPAAPHSPVILHPLAFAGETSTAKRGALAADLAQDGQDAVVLADTTSVAWLLNIRGADVPCTPVVLAFAILHRDARVDLFVEPDRVATDVRDGLGSEVSILPPAHLEASLAALGKKTVALDPTTTPVWFTQVLERHDARIVEANDPCALPRARKNDVEQQGARTAHLRDAVAVCRFLHWMDQHAIGSTELGLVKQLAAFRAEAPDYRGDSFDTIAGAGPNGAIIHYRVTPETDRTIEADTVCLIDSGGQYPDGTTDITRTVWTGSGTPPAEVKAAFTRVLKGNLRLGAAVFPQCAPGSALDALARLALWEGRLDFDHGTGHGVGSYLSVHEGPQRISKMANKVALEPGMIVSNEPGYYRPGAFGIRLETLVLVTAPEPGPENRMFLSFETLTLAPFDKRLIDVELLGADDAARLDEYHAQVLKKVGPLLPAETAAWLSHACSPINRK